MRWDGRYGVEAMIVKPSFQKHFFREHGRDKNTKTRNEVRQTDIRGYVHFRYI